MSFLPSSSDLGTQPTAEQLYRTQIAWLRGMVWVIGVVVVVAGLLSAWVRGHHWLSEQHLQLAELAQDAQRRIEISRMQLQQTAVAVEHSLRETRDLEALRLPPSLHFEPAAPGMAVVATPNKPELNYNLLIEGGDNLGDLGVRRWVRAVHRAVPAMELYATNDPAARTVIVRGDMAAIAGVPSLTPSLDLGLGTAYATLAESLRGRRERLAGIPTLIGSSAGELWRGPIFEPHRHAPIYLQTLSIDDPGSQLTTSIEYEIPIRWLFAASLGDSHGRSGQLSILDRSGRPVLPASEEFSDRHGEAARAPISWSVDGLLLAEPVDGGMFSLLEAISLRTVVAQLWPTVAPSFLVMLVFLTVLYIARHTAVRRLIRPRRQIARDLEEAREVLGQVFDLSPVGLCVVEADSGRVVTMNGSARHALRGLDASEGLDVAMRRAGWNLLAAEPEVGESGCDTYLVERTSESDRAVLRILHASSGHAYEVVALVDLTQERESQERANQAWKQAESVNSAMRSFVAAVSHEIRTPLTGICGGLELLELESEDAGVARVIEALRASSLILRKTVDDLLDFSKIEAGQMDIAPAPGQVRQVIGLVADFYRASVRAKGLRFHVRVAGDVPAELVLDWLRVKQVLGNLIDNAIKFTQSGHVIVWAGMADSCTFELSVTDSGCGIPAAAMERLFTPFARLQGGEARSIRGTGLGLTISKRICELHGGTLNAISHEGVGSQFRVLLPIDEVAAAPRSPSNRTEEVSCRRRSESAGRSRDVVPAGARVLVVEDDPTCSFILQQQLRELGASVLSASNSAEALRLLADDDGFEIRCVITDLGLPDQSGDELARQIRRRAASHPNFIIPILGLTASALPEDRQRCLDAGMTDVLVKPTSLAELGAVLGAFRISAPPGPRITASEGFGTSDVVVQTFRQHLAEDLAAIEGWSRAGNWSAIVRRAHRIVGGAGFMAQPTLLVAARAVELDASENASGPAVLQLMSEMRRVLRRPVYVDPGIDHDSITTPEVRIADKSELS